ncbi:MAG: exonuclease domain-containing protein [Tenericutes bacterium]|nr:exonuclease domain-containing protein [Mycoplasmatota bacterium]
MRKIIHSVDPKLKIFYMIFNGRKLGFYMTNRLSKTFFPYLRKGVLIDFEITARMKKIGNMKYYQVAHFNQIISLQPYVVHYDLYKLREDMRTVLASNKYYLFIDFEMTMPGYRDRDCFKSEIIQVGYVLSEAKGNIILQDGYYILPKERRTLSRRTKRFLKLEEETFFNEATEYENFYQKLQDIINIYQPKFVCWGKNDVTALNDSYEFHDKKRLTLDQDFIDLLKLHKDYFNLRDDLGLFKAYKTYYQVDFEQAHDAKDDALVTKYVFDAFLDYM